MEIVITEEETTLKELNALRSVRKYSPAINSGLFNCKSRSKALFCIYKVRLFC